MAIDTKPNLSSGKFEQCVGDILNLSGCTQLFGTFDVYPSGSIDSCSGYKISGVTLFNGGNFISAIKIGQNAISTQVNDIAIGASACATGAAGAIAIGNNTKASGTTSIAIGVTSCAGAYGTAVGNNAKATYNRTTAIGLNSCANYFDATAIGSYSIATGGTSVAISCAKATSAGAIAIGSNTCATAVCTIAMGVCAKATGGTSVAIGYNSYATALYSTVLGGYNSCATNTCALAIGISSCATGVGSIAIGNNVCVLNTTAIAIGSSAKATGNTATAISLNSCAFGQNSIAIGSSAKACYQSISIGASNCAYCDWAVAIGTLTTATQQYSIALGACATTPNSGAIALGYQAIAGGNNSVALGYAATTCGAQAIAIGFGTLACNAASIAIGQQSRACCDFGIAIGYANISKTSGGHILGGCDNILGGSNTSTILVGGSGIRLTGATVYSGYVVVPNFAILCTPSTGVCTDSVLTWNSTDKKIKILPYSSGGTSPSGTVSGEKISKCISQASHGFSVGNVVGWSGGTYNKPIANGLYDGEVLGIVTKCINANCFELTQAGYVTGLTSLSTNTTYFLSSTTAGLLTSTEPSVDGQISKSVLIADSSTSGWVLPYPGYIVTTGTTGGGSSVCEFTICGNGSATGFTVQHNLNKQFVMSEIVQAASPYATIYTAIQRPNANCVCVLFDTAPLNGTCYKILISG